MNTAYVPWDIQYFHGISMQKCIEEVTRKRLQIKRKSDDSVRNFRKGLSESYGLNRSILGTWQTDEEILEFIQTN